MKAHLPVTTPRSPDMDATEDESESLISMERRQQEQKQKQRQLDFEAGLMEERTERIQAIENNIIDVNQILRMLSSMVHHQGEVIGMLDFVFSQCELSDISFVHTIAFSKI